jgi:hypothetical protein
MVGPRADIVVETFAWGDEIEAHLSKHKVTRADIRSVLANAPRYFENLDGRAGSHVMVGANDEGRYFYVSISRTQRASHWYPVTAWPLGRRGPRIYNTGGNE